MCLAQHKWLTSCPRYVLLVTFWGHTEEHLKQVLLSCPPAKIQSSCLGLPLELNPYLIKHFAALQTVR